jgi:3-isopropylmalate dehydrogenase
MPNRLATLAVLPGDGIGPEITRATQTVLEAAARHCGLTLVFSPAVIGFDALRNHGTTLPQSSFDIVQAADGAILGPVSHNEYPPVAEGGINPSGALRKRLDLFANIRPAKTVPGLPPRCGKDVDLIIVRENTEGFYSDRNMFAGNGEFMPTPDVAIAVRNVTRAASMRIAEVAFELAAKRRGKVTSVHKANVFRLSDGLYLECTREVAKRYPQVSYEERLVDAMAALLVRDAGAFDVSVTTNMFGDILSDQASEISGSLGLAASLNAGTDHALAQAQHGSAPDLAGRNIANPASLIGSAAMLMHWLGERRAEPAFQSAAVLMHRALEATCSAPQTRTTDLGGTLGTDAFTAAVLENLEAFAE